jgi:hypothetical protein
VFGRASGFDATLNFAALDGANGFRLDGIDRYDFSGWSVAGAGDISGDGFSDLIIGAPGADSYQYPRYPAPGESYVVFGGAAGFGASFDLATLDGTNGFRLDGIGFYANSGFSVAGAGGRQRRRPGRSRHRRRHPRCIWQSFGIWCQRRSHYA